jgi:hypothetical protein
VLPTTGMPDAVAGEFAFAASGTCLVTSGRDAWFATGGAARVFHSRDGGATWLQGGDLTAYRSRVDWVTFAPATLIAVSPTGSDITFDGARSWQPFDTAPYDAVDCVPLTCWASGPSGAVAILTR